MSCFCRGQLAEDNWELYERQLFRERWSLTVKGKRVMRLEALKVCLPTDFEDIYFKCTDCGGVSPQHFTIIVLFPLFLCMYLYN